VSDIEPKPDRRKLGFRVVRAFLFTAAYAVFWFIIWFLTYTFLASFPEYPQLFTTIACGLLFFTFAITLAEDTIYKYILKAIRAFFLIAYLTYATKGGILTLNLENIGFTVEFVPLLALMIVINLLDIARALLQAIEFAAQSPKD